MGLIRATTGTDFMSGVTSNVISDFDGTAMLAPLRNLVPDPGFNQWKIEDGTLRYWDFGEPAKPTHWLMFVRDTHEERNYSRQISGPLRIEKEIYNLSDPLVPGAGPLQADMLVDIAKPLKPKVKAYNVGNNVGFPAGWYCIAYGYDVSKKYRIGKRITGPGPRSEPFELGQGNGFYVRLPSAPPEGVDAIIYYLTEPANAATPEMAQVQALSGKMFIQDKIKADSKSDILKFYGPIEKRYRYDSNGRNKNRTYIGHPEDMAPLTYAVESSPYGNNVTYNRTEITIGYKLVTESGKSVSKISKQTLHIDEFGATMIWLAPEEFEEDVIGWIPEIYSDDPITAELTKHIIIPGLAPDRGGGGGGGGKNRRGGRGRGGRDNRRKKGKDKKDKKTKDLPYFKVTERAPVYGTEPKQWPTESGTSLVVSDDLEDYNDSLDDYTEEEEEGTFSSSVTAFGKLSSVRTDRSGRRLQPAGRLTATMDDDDDDEGYQPMGGTETTATDSSLTSTSMDETGVEAPTDAPEAPVVVLLNSSGLTPGMHYVKTALFVEEEEGPASEPTKEKVEMGDGLKIHRPKWHDKLTNSDLGDRDIDGKPVDWDFLNVTPDYLPEKKGVIQLSDDGDADEDADFFVTPPAELNPDHDRFVVTMKFHYRKRVSGGMEVRMKTYNEEDEVLSEHRLDRFSRRKEGRTYRQDYRLSQRAEDVQTPTLTKIPVEATYVRCTVKGTGSRKRQGKRNQIVRMSDFGAFEGWAVPETIDVDLEAAKKSNKPIEPDPLVPDYEYNKFVRPHGGYCTVRVGALDSPIDATYVMKDYTVFETGTNEGWVQNVSDFNSMIGEIREEAGLFSKYGVYMAGEPTEDDEGRTVFLQKIFNEDTTMTVSWDLYIDSYNEEDMALGAIRDVNGEILAVVSITRLGSVLLQYNTPSGLSNPTIAVEGLDDGMLVHFKLSLNVLTGVVVLNFGSDEDSVDEVARIEGIDFSQFENAIGAVLGPSIPGFAVNRFASFKFIYGKIEVSNIGDWSNIQRQPGNYIEYYGPRGTPRNALYGPTGLRLPCKALQDYSLGVTVWFHHMSAESSLFSYRAMDADHNVLQTYTPLVPDFTGPELRWTRHTATIHTPENTAYIEFHANRLGQGVLKIHGLQVEEGSEATAFNMDMQRKGHFSVYFQNAQDQVAVDDPAKEIGHVKKLRNINVAGTDTDQVSYIARYRAGDTFEELDALPLDFEYEGLDMGKTITEVRVDLASKSDSDTPEIRSIELDVERPYSQLLQYDGTEYRGGTLAFDIGTPTAPPNLEVTDLASGAKQFDEWGYETNRTISFKVWVFRRSTSEAISSSYEHVLETDDKRYAIVTAEPIVFAQQVGTRIYFNDGREYFQVEEADITGFIISEETLL
jgi:hypothetical protein